VIQNVEKVLAIELIAAVQALEFRRPLKSSGEIESLVKEFRKKISFNESDRFLHEDMVNAIQFMREYELE
jgi:histidine ammonia-lyase